MLARDDRSPHSICRALREPPPIKRSCCIRVPDEIIKNPDPATYDAVREFTSGNKPTFNSPDLTTVNIWPVSPINDLGAIVRNLSSEAGAQRTRVDLSWSAFGIGMPRFPLASAFVDLARAGFPGSERMLTWPLSAAVRDANRYGIFIDIAHPYDRDPSNNAGQQTVEGMQTSQGRSRTFVVPVRNPLPSVQTINLALSPSPVSSWATVAPAAFTLAPGAQQNVLVAITVPNGVPASPPGTLISATIDLSAAVGGALIGGVAFLILLDA